MTGTTSPGRDSLVGGVMCGWNAYQETGATLVSRAAGPLLWDDRGREFIDWNMGWGSLVLGHTPDVIRRAVLEALDAGFGFPYETERAERLGALIRRLTGLDRVRLCNSGMEATQHALRLARRATGRSLVAKFEGHFHGLHDGLLYGVDSGRTPGAFRPDGTLEPVAGSAGLPDQALTPLLRVLPFNDGDAVERLFVREGDRLAAVILEPIALNMGCIRPDPGFLAQLRRSCDAYGVVLIFDEVRTGFRVAPGGAIESEGVEPDLACYGKAIGCGMPLAAVVGRRAVMDHLSPVGDVEMAGTNTGRNLTLTAGLAALEVLTADGVHQRLNALENHFVEGARAVLARHGVPAFIEGAGGTIGLYLGVTERPRSFRDVLARWNRPYQVACYRRAYEAHGLYGFLLPQADCPEALVMSLAHDEPVIDRTLERFDQVLGEVPYFERP